jgi:hypothetical protein|tara:strand:+ start:2015 stop:2320 length:306 start_codon:yes stop_codon:yes gene_type:complete
MARPKKYNIDTKQLQKLSKFGCTNKEMADFFGCSPDLLEKSYSEFMTKGRSEMKMRLRQLQWRSAEKGNVTMQIFLGKNILGQQDKLETTELDEPLVWSAD